MKANLEPKICLIEDDPSQRASMEQILVENGYEVVFFERAWAAYEALAQIPKGSVDMPGLILVDDLLPDQLGGEFCLKLRGLDGYQETPIVLMSSQRHPQIPVAKMQEQFGCNAVITKPITEDPLITLIEAFLPAGVMDVEATVDLEAVNESGELDQEGYDIAHILGYLHRTKFTGDLVVQKEGGIQKSIYWDHGQIISAATTLAAESVPSLLLEKGLLNEEKIRDGLTLCQGNEAELPNQLMQMKLLSPHQVFEVIQDQVEKIVTEVLNWKTGDYLFTEGTKFDLHSIHVNLEFPQIFLHFLASCTDEERLFHRLGSGKWILFPTEQYVKNKGQVQLNAQQARIATLANGSRNVGQILENAPVKIEALRVLFFLHSLGLLRSASQ